MLVEPTPLGSGRQGRLRTLGAIAIPVILLAGVVAVGVSGRTDEAPDPVAEALVVAPTSAPASTIPAGDAPGRVASADEPFPSQALGLATRSVTSSLEAHRAGSIQDDLVAIGGWLTIRPDRVTCEPGVTDTQARALCWREGILRTDGEPVLAISQGAVHRLGGFGTHLHPVVPAGVSLGRLDRDTPDADDEDSAGALAPSPVVLLGHFDDDREQLCPEERDCDDRFVVERLVWANGRWQGSSGTVARIGAERLLTTQRSRRIASAALSHSTVLLSQALVSSALMERLDPVAAAATRAAVSVDLDRLWYLRLIVLEPATDGAWTRSVGWVTVDDRTGVVLALGDRHGTRSP